ncbi:hypothetical protein BDZ85DRAFT_267804 [Elsinoe ampelina]|uniref:Uncharacterized protein n=1 Tax=Elsinoe ampelina TaxID=302913 RepID=A0A6A6G3A0_9PEZI|nr:hypothetical protein BDZ85DRAFT_267804 [Elsinoe ampelina]
MCSSMGNLAVTSPDSHPTLPLVSASPTMCRCHDPVLSVQDRSPSLHPHYSCFSTSKVALTVMCTYQDCHLVYEDCQRSSKHLVTRRKYSLCRDPEPDPNSDDRHCWDAEETEAYPEVSVNDREQCPTCLNGDVTIVVEYE